jgi:hypothetical protein
MSQAEFTSKPPKKAGVIARWGKGFVAEQREQAYPPRLREFNSGIVASMRDTITRARATFASMGKPQAPVESFQAWATRHELTAEFIEAQGSRFRTTHLALYLLAGLTFVYSIWLTINAGLIFGLVSVLWSLGIAIQGYIFGFRAWQMLNRRRIRFSDAVFMPETYLVI